MACIYNFTQFTVTGDCENNGSGGFTLFLETSAEPMSITWYEPNPWSPNLGGGPPVEPNILNGSITYSNLLAGTYVFEINDSCSPENNRETINITVSSGSSCVNIDGVVSTTCGLNNGILTATTQNIINTATIVLYKDGIPIETAFTNTTFYVFNNLEPGIYYVNTDNGGGCTGNSETAIVLSSTSINYGLYVVNDADCGNVASGVGKIYITGLTGVAPYTYQWTQVNSNYLIGTGQITSGTSITGLTSGLYSVTVTDSQGCELTQSASIDEIPPVVINVVEPTPPTCFDENGQITIIVSNGTPPYRYYIPSRSFIDISYSQTYTFSGLPGGNYEIIVTDSALCQDTTTVQLNQPNSFSIGSVNITNPKCGNSNGQISISLIGDQSKSYTYTLSSSTITTENISTTSNIFTGLPPNNYLLTISDGVCTFSRLYTLTSQSPFTVSYSVTGTSCNENNGSVLITASTGQTGLYTFSIIDINGNNNQVATNTGTSSYTFNNLAAGSYIGTVEDQALCEQNIYFTVNQSPSVDFYLYPTNSTNGSNGQIFANIVNGTPPFTLTWSPNVNGQTGTTVQNLSAGTYSLIVQDAAGCITERLITLGGTYNQSDTVLFNICDSVISSTGNLTERTMEKMLIEGYLDLTSGCTDCLLTSAIFSAVTNVAGTGYSQSFFTATTLSSYPNLSAWTNTITALLSGTTGIGDVIVDDQNNTITLNTDCDEVDYGLANQNVTTQLKIVYDINCVSCPP